MANIIQIDGKDIKDVVAREDISKLKISNPDPPNTDGTYTLQATVSSGTITYTWVSAT